MKVVLKHALALGALAGGVLVVPGAASLGGAVAAAEPSCPVPPADAVRFGFVGRYMAPLAEGSTATEETRGENVVYENSTMYVMNNGAIDVVDITNPAAPTLRHQLRLPGEPTSVAVNDGLVAVSVPATPKTDPGRVIFFRGTTKVGDVTVGALPDMVTFTHDGKLLAVANEGEPNSYGQPDSVDPEGSISVINTQPFRTNGALKGGTKAQPVETISFAEFNVGATRAGELPADVRIFGPGASVAQDIEPEYITIADDNRTAWVSLQENNALAQIDLRSKKVTKITALGYSDHSRPGFGFDASDQNGGKIDIAPHRTLGMYMPDGIATYSAGGQRFILTANEGDLRDWVGIVPNGDAEAARARSVADLSLFPEAGSNNDLGRLNVTTKFPATYNAAGKMTTLYSIGSRSFSVRGADGSLVWDSGDAFECITAATPGVVFNASNSNVTKKNRSDDKGPEPEIVITGKVGDRQLAFISLERVGGVMVYDVTNPAAPVFQQYLVSRDFSLKLDDPNNDSGPEGMAFVAAANSPTGRPLLLSGNEVSGTVAVFELAD